MYNCTIEKERRSNRYSTCVVRVRSVRACAPTLIYTGYTCRLGEGSSASEGLFSGIMPWAFGRRNVHGYRAPLILSNGNHPEITPGKSAFIVSQLNRPPSPILRNIEFLHSKLDMLLDYFRDTCHYGG